ncbi:MAG: hypothetical protein ACTSR8_12585 [Promethearchaeota archaeon]
MLIEWEKVEASPDRKYKVDGTSLLELKKKIEELEKNIDDEQKKLKVLKAENEEALEMADDATTTLNKENIELMEQLKVATKKIEALEAEIDSLKQDAQHTMELQNKIGELHKLLTNKEQEITQLTTQIAELNASISTPPEPSIENMPVTTAIPTPSQDLTSTLPPNISIPQFASFDHTRKQCPNCGASAFNIKEVEDRTKILSYIPKPIYAKKNVCTKCGYEF